MAKRLFHGKKIKEKIQERKESFYQILKKIYLGEVDYSKLAGRLVNGLKILIAATRKFIADDCFTKASSISYTAIMSLIPTLCVILTILSSFYNAEGNKEEMFRYISLFLKDNGINITIDPILAALSGLIDNAGKIGGISALFMIFTATAMLRSLEKSLNSIWKVSKLRPLFLRIIYYWAFLSLGPVMIITGATMATQISDFFSSPNFNGVAVSQNGTLWVVGNKAGIFKQGKELVPAISPGQIDFDNQSSYVYDEASGVFTESEHRIDQVMFEKIDLFDINFIGERGWIVGDRGIIMNTGNGGKSWSISLWDQYKLRRIRMIDESAGFCVGDRGILLKTDDGGVTWTKVESLGVNADLNGIAFYGSRGLITGDSGTIIQTFDGGNNWSVSILKAAEKSGRYLNLNAAHIVNDASIYIAGSEGLILNTSNGGITWKSQRYRQYNYRTAYFFNGREGLMAGERGTLIHTKNGGDTWQKSGLPTVQINRLLSVKSTLWAAGDTGLLMFSRDRGAHWHGREGRSFISLLINFLAPFVFIWILFLVAYISLPSTKVPFKHAAIGASFTGAVWVVFILLFIYYVKAFAKGTFAIYGALAAIPLCLLIIYSSSLIILYGAEVAYTLMHPESYLNLSHSVAKQGRFHVYYGISILYRIYEQFERKGGATSFQDLMAAVSNKTETVDFYTKLFTDKGIIATAQGGWIPLKSAKNVTVSDIVETMTGENYLIPPLQRRSTQLHHALHKIFGDLAIKRKEALGDITMADLIDRKQEHHRT